MDERIPITAGVPRAASRVDGSGPISLADVAEEIWQALKRKAAGERDVPPIGLVVQGGGMRGVYSMAVLAAFEEMGWTPCFDHVAGASAGAMNGAHFITGQARYGVETYIDYLSNRKFIDFFRLRKLVDLDYMIDDLVRHVRPFDLPALREASTELHIALADAEDASVHYVTNRSEDVDLWEAFRATGALPILYNRFVKVGDRSYLDGSLSECLPLPRLLALGCRYIVVVLTKPLSFRSQRVSRPLRALAWWSTRHYSPASYLRSLERPVHSETLQAHFESHRAEGIATVLHDLKAGYYIAWDVTNNVTLTAIGFSRLRAAMFNTARPLGVPTPMTTAEH